MSSRTLLVHLRIASLLLVASSLYGAEHNADCTIDLLKDWPKQHVDPHRSDAARRPPYQRVPGALLPGSTHAETSRRAGGIELQSFVATHEDPDAMLGPLAEIVLPVGPPEAWWIDAEYLYWWVKGMKNTPPLVTTSDDSDGGVVGANSTRILFPTTSLFQAPGSGGRVRFGHWWDKKHSHGITGDLWGFNGPNERFSIVSDGTPLIARPFFDTATASQNAEIVATTGAPPRSGGVIVAADSNLYSGGISWRWQLGVLRPGRARPCRDVPASFQFLPRGDIRLDFTCGYRFARLQEQLSVFENVTIPSRSTRFDVEDHFRTTNDFNGAEIGLHYVHHHCRWSFELQPRIAFGSVRQRTQINGSTLVTPSGGSSINESGGLLALAGTNIGTFKRDEFSIMPQVDARFGYRIRDRLTLNLGYSFLYWMRVARPGEQIDFRVNPNYLPSSNPFDPSPPIPSGPRDPRPLFADAAFWAQGLNLGLEYRF